MESNTNVTFNETVGTDKREAVETVLIAICLSLIIISSIVGNVAVIIAIYTNHILRNDISNMFIANLSVTDLASATLVMTSSVYAVSNDSWSLGQAVCDMVCMANYCFIIVSMLTLCFISFDRYLAIVWSLRYPSLMNRKKALCMIAYAWFQGLAFSVVPVVFRWVKYDYWEVVCAIQWHQQRNKALYYVIAAFVACFLLPGVMLVMFYSRVLKTANLASKRITALKNITQAKNGDQYSTSKKAMHGLIIVVVSFFICMTPFSVTKLYKVSVNKDAALPGYVNLIASLVAYISSAVNPFLYGIFRRDFRNAFKLILRKLSAERALATPDSQSTDIS